MNENKEKVENSADGYESEESEESYYSGLEEESSSSEEESNISEEENLKSSSSASNVSDEENDEEDWMTEPSGVEQKGHIKNEDYGKSQLLLEDKDVDTSDEEDIRNTVGNIPLEWYNEYPHIGYDLKGDKILKPVGGDELEKFLSAADDPDNWKTVHDKMTAKDVKLTDEDLEIIRNIQSGHYADKEMDPYKPYIDWFTGTTMVHPIKDTPQPKSSFIPSKWEHKRIMRLVRSIRNGWIKPKPVKDEKNKFYLLWGRDDTPKKDHPMHWPAPKARLPGHDESYNPPPEYLPTDEEAKRWEEMDPEDRPKNFLPKKFNNLRSVPGYSNFIQERFERCLDLYLCPRQRKMRLQVDPADLIPKLPKPRDLQPFPTTETLVYHGHTEAVTAISVDPTGQWLVSGSQDKSVRFWEISTCRCMKKMSFENEVSHVEWNPNPDISLVAVLVRKTIIIINPHLGDKLICMNTDNMIAASFSADEENQGHKDISWEKPPMAERSQGQRINILHNKVIKHGSWHLKGDYFSAVLSEGGATSVLIHQISKRKSQIPFKRLGGLVQCVKFHPTKPFLFVASQRFIRIYNLQRQELIKKLISGVKWISSMDIHPQGDNLIIGSYDKRLCWFDIDLSAKPYKTLRHHKKAISTVRFHKSYPLFASGSDDGSVIIFHGKVFSDLMQNPLIVPVKIIRCHKPVSGSGVAACQFHPFQPWIFTAGADKTIKLFT